MADLVAQRMTQNCAWWVAEVTAEVDRAKELERRELCRNLDFPHGLKAFRHVGSLLRPVLSLEQRLKSQPERNLQP